MKNLAIVFNVILAIAVGFLYYLHFKTTDVCNKQAKSVGKDSLSATTMPIAYINVDSLLSNYCLPKMPTKNYSRKVNHRAQHSIKKPNNYKGKWWNFNEKYKITLF